MTQGKVGETSPYVEERMRELWDAGLSASEIGRRYRCTKNTVIGLRYRRGWRSRIAIDPDRPRLEDRLEALNRTLDRVLAETEEAIRNKLKLNRDE